MYSTKALLDLKHAAYEVLNPEQFKELEVVIEKNGHESARGFMLGMTDALFESGEITRSQALYLYQLIGFTEQEAQEIRALGFKSSRC